MHVNKTVYSNVYFSVYGSFISIMTPGAPFTNMV